MEKLREQFLEETDIYAINSQGEPDIDYVLWLEEKVLGKTKLTAPDRAEEE
jgi:hypothetical protein